MFIIIGCGRMGCNLAYELSDIGHDVCVIDRDKERLSALGSGFNGKIINGIEFDSDNLNNAGIQQADALLAVTPDDNINITVSMVANRIYHVPQVIARVNDPKRKHLYDKLKIDVINPVQLATNLLLEKIDCSNCSIVAQLGNGYQIIEAKVSNDDFKLSAERIQQKYSCIISIVTKDEINLIPKNETILEVGDKLICTVHKSNKEKLIKALTREALIWMPLL